MSTRTMWRAVGVVLVTWAGIWALNQARGLVSLLVYSMFFALALVPGVNYLHRKRGWRRGIAVGFIYLVGVVFIVVMVAVLIPAIAQLAQRIGQSGGQWLTSLDHWLTDTFGVHLIRGTASKDAAVTLKDFLSQWSDEILGAATGVVSKSVALIASVATMAMFTFYFAADFPRLQRSFLSWFPPARQERLGWTIDQSIAQVGGYLYSRLLLTVINGLGFFAVMVAVGVPVGLAIPLAVFAGFVSEFIPNIGTYIGAAIPIVLTLALQGIVAALFVLGYALIYQQIENYLLSPRLSAKTMELNGGLAFGSALAGGALFGPMGAFMALPVAALIYSFVRNYRHSHEVVYRSAYAEDDQSQSADAKPPDRPAAGAADPDPDGQQVPAERDADGDRQRGDRRPAQRGGHDEGERHTHDRG
ncbi:MAG: AI-2E family transporter [Micromonosporaceae bacterium]